MALLIQICSCGKYFLRAQIEGCIRLLRYERKTFEFSSRQSKPYLEYFWYLGEFKSILPEFALFPNVPRC